MTLVQAYLVNYSIIHESPGDEFRDDYFVVELEFRTTLKKGGDTYKVISKGQDLTDVLRELGGEPQWGSIPSRLRSCRKKQVLLAVSQEGKWPCVKAILLR